MRAPLMVVGSHVYSSDGKTILPIDSLPQTINRNGDGSVNYIEVTDFEGATFRQTFGYTSGQVTSITGWERQS